MEEALEGYVENVRFRNEENAFTVFSIIINNNKEITCVGFIPIINEGEYVELTGEFILHSTYGKQFKINNYEIKEPEGVIAIQKYLSSGIIKGIKAGLAEKIVSKFKEDTFRIMEEEPEKLAEVKGISLKKAKQIGEYFQEKKEVKDTIIFLQQYGISNTFAIKIYNYYREKTFSIIKENPYKLADDIDGIGFKIADEIAIKVGIGINSDERIKAVIYYVLNQSTSIGHTYLPKEELLLKSSELINTNIEEIQHYIDELVLEKKIVVKQIQDCTCIYSSKYYYMELNVARMLIDLNIRESIKEKLVDKKISKIEDKIGINLDDLQKKAVKEAVSNGLMIITGGPGTGKTTIITTIIQYFINDNKEVLLAAPTGRAAKRMSETTGYEAQTIHRMLELVGDSSESDSKLHFERNEDNPLEADVIIIDEMSMVDIALMNSLLKAITIGTKLILVGDVNQLPSIGAGNVLKDIIQSKKFKVVQLNTIFRQAKESDIIVYAHKINAGQQIELNNNSRDFFLLKRSDVNIIIGTVIKLINEKLPRYVKTKPYDIQVLTPMRKGELGVERLNEILQKYLNPPSNDKIEKEFKHCILREGDKVMQIKNNYQLEWDFVVKNKRGTWSSYGSGNGVFNGDIGIVEQINTFSKTVIILFDDNKLVEYGFEQIDELELAYAITIHKSQGSEYPAVIIPLLTGPKMLLNRNILYTAVTRAKSCVTIVGSENTIKNMINNENQQKRYSGLLFRINEINNKNF